jgi:ATP-binding cassette subfamily G (WHITE) protein 2
LSALSEEDKIKVVNSVIKNLGLEKCRDTYVGDARIRGVSGGEKKRTSIGL